MSVSVLAGPLASLAPKLAKLLHEEYKLVAHVKKDVKWLHDQLESIDALFVDVGKVPWHRLNEEDKVWVRNVREASYDTEDALDTFLVRVHRSKPPNKHRLTRAIDKIRELWNMVKARRQLAVAVEDIKKHVEELAKTHQNYKKGQNIMSDSGTASSSTGSLHPARHKDVTQSVGVDKSTDEVISMLSNASQSDDDMPEKKIINKISIVGVGGLGKTTLAKAVYDKLKSSYDCAAFVSVGRNPVLERVFKDILFGLEEDKYEDIHNTGRGPDLLVSQIQKFLKNKRYFVVLDDVWNVQTWENIKLALGDNVGSKLITTTRMLDVAHKAADAIYKLKSLSIDDSMKLFCARLSTAGIKFIDYQSDDIVEKVLKKCAGIPLAIITMASLLARIKPVSEWSKVYDSIGFGPIDNGPNENTMTILSYSYYDLPPQLRTCLLYLSNYPEDYLIEKDSLIWKWIAEGFIMKSETTFTMKSETTGLFELGESYFWDLINTSLIQREETWDGRVVGCRVHDMVLDLMRKISIDENFIYESGENAEGQSTPSTVRRLAHQYRIVRHIKPEAKDTEKPKVRSYTAIMCYIMEKNWVHSLSFMPLRVLDIVHCSFEGGCHLEHLGDLLQLRYLGIRCGGSVPELPEQIGNLKLLLALDVDTKLPASIVQLTGLVRLCAEQADAPNGIGALTSLEELRIGRVNTEMFIEELGSLPKLRVLRFSIGEMNGSVQRFLKKNESMQQDFLTSLLFNLKNIQHIHMFGDFLEVDTKVLCLSTSNKLPRSLQFLDFSIQFPKLPSWISPTVLPYLAYLTLRVITMDEQDLKLLARLRALRYLWLETRSTTVTASNIDDGRCFQMLRYFRINAMVQFQRTIEKEASVSLHLCSGQGAMPFSSRQSKKSCKVVPSHVMPKLEVLQFCVPLRALKDNHGDCGNIGLEYMPSLREVTGWIDYDGMSAKEGDAMLKTLIKACKDHPNNPKLEMLARNKPKDNNVSTEDEEAEKQQQEAEVVSQRAHIDLSKLSPSCS